MANQTIPNGQTQQTGVVLSEFEERLRVNGTLQTIGDEIGVLTQGFNNDVRVNQSGEILSESTAIRVEGLNTEIDNRGLISGDFNGIDVANGDAAFAQIFNRPQGIITSESRAVNIGGIGALLDNRGLITTSADPRNGTVYGDVTAQNIFIVNRNSGVIDVGHGNNGDAISLELGSTVNGLIRNSGVLQGRGVALGNNQAAAVRLYWVPDAGPTSTFNGDIENLRRGLLAAETGPAVVVEEYVILNGDIRNDGRIESLDPDNGVGIRIEDGATINGTIFNGRRGEISGGRTGIDVGNGGTAIATIVNEGLIEGTSRAVNLGGNFNTLINSGTILTTDDPRNGTVYGDVTALNIEIENSGLIDVGHGNNGDAIALELGAVVNGSILNTGLVQGRGTPVPDTNTASSAIRLYWVESAGAPVSQFNGDIINHGELAAEQGATLLIDDRVALNGVITNSGLITGGLSDSFSGQLAVDTSGAVSPITLINTGEIVGDVRLSQNNDVYVGTDGTANGSVDGVVFGNGGNDQLIGSDADDIFAGGTGDDFILSNDGDDLISGGSGNDFIDAGAGNDTINAGSGVNFVLTGAGHDTVVLSDQGFTVVADFTVGQDSLSLSGLDVDDLEINSLFNSTVIISKTTGDAIAFLPFVDAASLDTSSFTHLPDNPLLGGTVNGLPTVSVYPDTDAFLSEADQNSGSFVFQLSEPAPAGGLTINFQAGDTDPVAGDVDVEISGENISDFTVRPIPGFVSSVTIEEGATEARLTVTPFPGDTELEADEVISLDLLPGDGYTVDPGNIQAGFTLLDELTAVNPPSFGPVISGTPDNDVLNGTDGRDQTLGGDGNDVISGLGRRDLLNGEDGDDILHGGAGADELSGGNGTDLLNGGAGDDLIDGGSDSDALFGGAGADQFVISPTSGVDIVFDYEAGIDQVVLTDGLTLGQVSVVQSGSDALLLTTTGAPLAGFVNVQASDLFADLTVS
ncbi:MAG: beta strand repeat-containing protein [Thainema sp.]